MKYMDDDDEVKTVVTERYLFKGVENYFTDSLMYTNGESDKEPPLEDSDSAMRPILYQNMSRVFSRMILNPL